MSSPSFAGDGVTAEAAVASAPCGSGSASPLVVTHRTSLSGGTAVREFGIEYTPPASETRAQQPTCMPAAGAERAGPTQQAHHPHPHPPISHAHTLLPAAAAHAAPSSSAGAAAFLSPVSSTTAHPPLHQITSGATFPVPPLLSLAARSSAVPLRDHHRALLYLRSWNDACVEAEAEIEWCRRQQRHDAELALSTPIASVDPSSRATSTGLPPVPYLAAPSRPDAFTVLLPVATAWSLALDDLVLPCIESMLTTARRARNQRDKITHREHTQEQLPPTQDVDDASLANVDHPDDDLDPDRSFALYRSIFVCPSSGSLRPSMLALPTSYPLLSTLLRSRLRHGVDQVRRCCRRLRSDWALLRSREGRTQLGWAHLEEASIPLWPDLSNIEPTGSDGHSGGQGVWILSFATGGRRLVYKPFGGQCSHLFERFVDMVREIDPRVDFHVMRVLVPAQHSGAGEEDGPLETDLKANCCQENAASSLTPSPPSLYCWATHIAVRECTTAAAVRCYYERAGMMSAICEALSFTDGHRGNVLCDGESPVLIDCETMFQPLQLARRAPSSSSSTVPSSSPLPPAPLALAHHLLSTLLVQSPPSAFSASSSTWKAGFQHVDLTRESTPTAFTVARERSAVMYLRYGAGTITQSRAIPRLGGDGPQYLVDHQGAFMAGYARAAAAVYRLLSSTTSSALNPWFRSVTTASIRVVPRPTSFYVLCLRRLQQCDALADPALARSALRAILVHHRPDIDARVVESELEDLLIFDVPIFFMTPGGDDMMDARGRRVPMIGTNRPGHRFTRDDTILRFSPAQVEARLPAISAIICKDPRVDIHIDRLTMMDCIYTIAADALASLSVPTGIDIRRDLYLGLSGTMMFLAAATSMPRVGVRVAASDDGDLHGGTATVRELPSDSRADLSSILSSGLELIGSNLFAHLDHLAENNMIDRPSFTHGAFTGTAGILYALALAGRMSGRPDWIHKAAGLCVRLVSFVTLPTTSGANVCADMVSGVSGTICAVLAIRHVLRQSAGPSVTTTDPRPSGHVDSVVASLCASLLSFAVACGHALLAHPHPFPHRTLPDVVLTGVSHGLAGGVLAMRRLQEATGGEEACRWGQQARRWAQAEDEQFQEETRAWKDMRYHVGEGRSTSSTYQAVHDESHTGHQPHRVALGSATWCYGMAGIVMSRRSCLDAAGSSSVLPLPESLVPLRDLHRFVRSLSAEGNDDLTMCCGISGILDAMVMMRQGLDGDQTELESASPCICPASSPNATSVAPSSSMTDASTVPQPSRSIPTPFHSVLSPAILLLLRRLSASSTGASSSFDPQSRFGLMRGVSGVGYAMVRAIMAGEPEATGVPYIGACGV